MGRIEGRLGVLGGTFDPPHWGHLLMADTAYAQLGLERVLFALAGHPPHKPKQPVSNVSHRLAMLQMAIADEPGFELSRIDIDRPGPHYTVDALTTLGQIHPQANLYLVIGADSLAELPGWRQPERIVQLAQLAVMPRSGYTNAQNSPHTNHNITWLEGPSLDVSSTALRRRVRLGLPLRYLTPPTVANYIQEHKLYHNR